MTSEGQEPDREVLRHMAKYRGASDAVLRRDYVALRATPHQETWRAWREALELLAGRRGISLEGTHGT